MTGDVDWLRGGVRPRRASPQRPDGGIGETDAERIRDRARAVLVEFRDRGGTLPSLPSSAVLEEMMCFSLGQKIAPEYVPMMLEDMMLGGPGRTVPDLRALSTERDFHAIVIGAGMSGILAALKLGQAGVRCTVLEKNADLGG